MAYSLAPFGIVALSAGSYSVLLSTVRSRWPPSSTAAARAQLKAISAGHAATMALMAAVVLRQPLWEMPLSSSSLATGDHRQRRPKHIDRNLDDTTNPIIQGRSSLANAITAWETGYLLYDTGALLQAVHGAPVSSTFVAHHLLLITALLYLQIYIAKARERGIWVINALFLMNATNPLLHVRWCFAKQGKVHYPLEVLFAFLFGASRFGIVAWILSKYGSHHQIGPLEAFLRLRRPCQAGTATIVGLNAFWWCFLVKNLLVRTSAKIRKSVRKSS